MALIYKKKKKASIVVIVLLFDYLLERRSIEKWCKISYYKVNRYSHMNLVHEVRNNDPKDLQVESSIVYVHTHVPMGKTDTRKIQTCNDIFAYGNKSSSPLSVKRSKITTTRTTRREVLGGWYVPYNVKYCRPSTL